MVNTRSFIDSNLASPVVINVAMHSTTLTEAESSSPWIIFSGALTANVTFQLSGTARVQLIENATSGNFDLGIKRGTSGTVYVITPNEIIEVR